MSTIDFSSAAGATTFADRIAKLVPIAEPLTVAQLRAATNASLDTLLSLIEDATDADVTFVPQDQQAFDAHAAPEQQHDGWTLGHVIVHQTASSEEGAFIAAELARGVENHGRSRYETNWELVKTIAHVRQRIAESRRMRLATLDIWPDTPNLSNTYSLTEGAPPVNAQTRFLLGLYHEHEHCAQIAGIMQQARAARK